VGRAVGQEKGWEIGWTERDWRGWCGWCDWRDRQGRESVVEPGRLEGRLGGPGRRLFGTAVVWDREVGRLGGPGGQLFGTRAVVWGERIVKIMQIVKIGQVVAQQTR